MPQRITVLVNDYREIQPIVQDLSSAGIPINEIELIHKRTQSLETVFTNENERPRISDRDVSPVLRNSDIADEDIRYCEMRVDNGATLLSVNVQDAHVDQTLSILKQHRVAIPSEKDAPAGQVLRKGTPLGTGSYKDLTKLEKIESFRIKATDFDPKGWDVVDPNDDKIGDIKYIIGNQTTGRLTLLLSMLVGCLKTNLSCCLLTL